MLSVKEAAEKVLSVPIKKKTEKVYILDSLYSIVAEDIISHDDIPAYDNSAVNGYALRTSDLLGAEKNHPVKLKLLRKDIPSGRTTGFVIESGTCIK